MADIFDDVIIFENQKNQLATLTEPSDFKVFDFRRWMSLQRIQLCNLKWFRQILRKLHENIFNDVIENVFVYNLRNI